MGGGSARRLNTSVIQYGKWHAVERCVLLAEPGAQTGPHQDSHGFDKGNLFGFQREQSTSFFGVIEMAIKP